MSIFGATRSPAPAGVGARIVQEVQTMKKEFVSGFKPAGYAAGRSRA